MSNENMAHKSPSCATDHLKVNKAVKRGSPVVFCFGDQTCDLSNKVFVIRNGLLFV